MLLLLLFMNYNYIPWNAFLLQFCINIEDVLYLREFSLMMYTHIQSDRQGRDKRDTMCLVTKRDCMCCCEHVSHAQCDVMVYFGLRMWTRRQNELDKTTSLVLAAFFCFLWVWCSCLSLPLKAFFTASTLFFFHSHWARVFTSLPPLEVLLKSIYSPFKIVCKAGLIFHRMVHGVYALL